MSKSGQWYVASTQGSSYTMYAMMRMMGIPLSPEQEKTQDYLERTFPPVILEGEEDYGYMDRPRDSEAEGGSQEDCTQIIF